MCNDAVQSYCTTSVCFSFHFNGHFPGGPGVAGSRMSPFWILLELSVMEVVMTAGAISSGQNVTTNKPTPNCFTGRMPFLSPNQQCQSTEGNTSDAIRNTHVSLSPSSIIWYQPMGGDTCLAAGKVTVGLASHWPHVTDISGSLPTGSRPRRGR